ncbi:MAG: proline--tRNA ligase [Armatimonadota bacterium]
MRTTQLFAPTLRQVSGEVELASHRLLLRAGFVRQLAAGMYSLLPLGLRVARKVETIVREEMDAAGAQEVFLPALHPLELWERTGRAQYWGPELFRLQDRTGRWFCLGGTHEEVITLLAAERKSYRDLPFTLYQIQTKFRDDPRPRGGLIRVREFTMKDAYSFDRDTAGLDRSYDVMVAAYHKILARIGLSYHVVDASGGGIGGWDTREFELPTPVGENHYLRCDSCGYTATPEIAEFRQDAAESSAPQLPIERADTPDKRTIEQVCEFLGVPPRQLVKTLIYRAGDRVIAALVRGDRELSEDKLKALLGVRQLQMADPDTIQQVSGAPVGFAGPVGIRGAHIVADEELRGERNFVTGGNEADLHLRNVNWGRDFQVEQWSQLRNAEPGDRCGKCGTQFTALRGIELAHVFKLGTVYSETLEACFLDEGGVRRPMVMGCYGIGIGRMMAAAVEQFHDDAGIIWPASIAPYQVIIIPVNHDDEAQRSLAESLYDRLQHDGREVILEDRPERPGVKFKDADLMGIPAQIVVGRLAGEGKVELRRRGGERRTVSAEEAVGAVRELLATNLVAPNHESPALNPEP